MSKPQVMELDVLLTAQSPIVHGDPGMNGVKSNIITFNRRKQRVQYPEAKGVPVHQHILDEFCTQFPVVSDVRPALEGLDFAEFASIALARFIIDIYSGMNGGDGAGLFNGLDRYTMLQGRLVTSAVRSSALQGFWSLLCKELQLPVLPDRLYGGEVRPNKLLLSFFKFPAVIQRAMLSVFIKNTAAVIAIARDWAEQQKLQNQAYAEKRQLTFTPQEETVLTFRADELTAAQPVGVIDAMWVSGNSLRHHIREAAWQHLAYNLEIPASWAGEGPFPPSVEALFRNGGNLKQGASAPSNAALLAAQIRRAFPSLDLLGGNVDNFDLGESMLKVATHLVCAENRGDLPEWAQTLPMANLSMFDMLDDITHTRQAVNGLHQMIYKFEALVPGTQVVLRLLLNPFAATLTQSALQAAVETYANMAIVAGKSGEGFGHATAEVGYSTLNTDTALYEAYLAEHKDTLRAALFTASLGTDKEGLLS